MAKKDLVIRILKICIIIALNIFVITAAFALNRSEPSIAALSKRGSRGSEVKAIQRALKKRKFYKGKIDGIYGKRTVRAVRRFQRKKKLKVDGIAGPKTLKKLGIKPPKKPKKNQSNINLLSRIISAEAKGEPYSGQIAVGACVMNRVAHPSFPDTIAGVIYQTGEFSPVDNGEINKPPTASAKRAARAALTGTDPSGGSIFFFNPKKTKDKWLRTRPVLKVIGAHVFCK